jgi:hypothetical protein
MDSALPAFTLRALVGTDGARPRERALDGIRCAGDEAGHSELMLAREAEVMFAPPFDEALARGGGFEVVCSNILIVQKMQPMARMLIAITSTHINPIVVPPAWFT